jgi:hypothetical protein
MMERFVINAAMTPIAATTDAPILISLPSFPSEAG